jgi:phosphatidylserine decarboxylase
LCAGGAYLAWGYRAWFWVVVVLAGLGWTFVLSFFRDPQRDIPADEGLFVSPADGRVADITQIGPESPLRRDGVQIGIFMNVFNVHVNRSPCDGQIERIEHTNGAFLDARDPAASQRNESAAIAIKYTYNGIQYPIVVRQIAGLIARRIVTDLKAQQQVRRGERIGMIKFGSRVELLAPRELVGKMRAEIGRCVKAGETILFEARKSEAS